MKINLIVAMAQNRVIGKDGKIPWHIPNDLKRFKSLTYGNAVLMGRKTFDSIGKSLDGRLNLVLSNKKQFTRNVYDDVRYSSMFSVLHAYAIPRVNELFIIGGAQVYKEALERDLIDRIYLTQIHKDFDGDTYMPEWDAYKFKLINSEFVLEPDLDFAYSFVTLDRALIYQYENNVQCNICVAKRGRDGWRNLK